MSAETKAALEAALAAHIADETDTGAILTGYVLHASYIDTGLDSRGSTGYFAEFHEGQPYHVGYGLAHQLVDHYHVIWEDDDDD